MITLMWFAVGLVALLLLDLMALVAGADSSEPFDSDEWEKQRTHGLFSRRS